MEDEVLARVRASAPRRWMGIAMLATIGGLSIYVALAAPPALIWQLFLLAVGALALFMAERLRRATELTLELTETELRDSGGRVLARVADIQSLDSSFFAFKPSNGFLIRTKTPAARAWRPGLWWRVGRRIGIGGVTPGSQTKMMAEILSAMLARRDQDSQTS